MSIEFNISGEIKKTKSIYTNINGEKKQVTAVLYGTNEGIKYLYNYSSDTYDYVYGSGNSIYCTNDFITAKAVISVQTKGKIKGLLKKSGVYYCFCKSASADSYTAFDEVYTSTDKVHWSVSTPTGVPKANSGSKGWDQNKPIYVVNGTFYFVERIASYFYACTSEDGITWDSKTIPSAGSYSSTFATLSAYGVISIDNVAYLAMYSYRTTPSTATKDYEFTFGSYENLSKNYDVSGNTGYAYAIDRSDINQLWLCNVTSYRSFTVSNGTMTKTSSDTTSTTPNPRWCDNNLYGYSGTNVYKNGSIVATLDQNVQTFVSRKEGGILIFDNQSNIYSLDRNDLLENIGVAINVPTDITYCIAEEPEE